MKRLSTLIFALTAIAVFGATAPTKFRYGIDTKFVNYDDATELTISSGVITATQSIHTVDGEGDLSDDLATINGYATVNRITLYPANTARDITIKHGTGNIVTADGIDYTVPDNGLAILQYDGSNWRLNPAGKINVPTSVTDRAVAVFDGITGTALIDSGVTVDSGQNLATPNSITYDPSPTVPAITEGLTYYDSTNKCLAVINDCSDCVMNVGQEVWIRAYNDSGATITNGTAAYLSGVFNGFATIDEADASDSSKCISTLGIATHNILNNDYGYITRLGTVNDVDTSSFTAGDPLYLSGTNPGELINTIPDSPAYRIRIGNVGVSDATAGTIEVSIDGDNNTQGVIAIFNGATFDDSTVDVTSDGSTITATFEKTGGGDLSLFFSGLFEVFDSTPVASVVLTPGSDTVPTQNFVYIPQSTMTLTANTTGFPTTGQFVPVATVICQSAASAQLYGLRKVHSWTDHLNDTQGQGHLSHINKWIRSQHATYESGVDYTFTPTIGGGTAIEIDLSLTAGTILQLHTHPYPALNTATGEGIHIVNDPTTPFNRIEGLIRASLTHDSVGVTLANRYYNMAIWGVVSEDPEDSHIFANLPSGSYGSDADAIADASKYTDTSIPPDYKGVGFLICQVRLKDKSADGTLEVLGLTDLRGDIPGIGAGGGGGGIGATTFADTSFAVFNVTDDTKRGKFSAGSITTGTTRTYTMPDATGTITLDNNTSTLTNKTIDVDLNTLANISDSEISDTAAIDATKIGDGSVTTTEFGYIGTLSGDAQTQLNTKQATITGAATTISGADLSANWSLVSNASGKVAIGGATSTEQGYLSGVTGAIQTQLNDKSPVAGSSSLTTTGTITSGTWNGTGISVSYGGTGASNATLARSNLSAAASGVNSDITSTTALASLSLPGDITIASTGAGVNINTHTDAGDDLAVNTNMLVVEGDTGRVGIGVTAPGNALQVNGDIKSTSLFTYSSGSSIHYFNNGSQTANIAVDFDDDVFKLSNSVTLDGNISIDSSGNVGVNTTSPNSNLDVVGTFEVGDGTDSQIKLDPANAKIYSYGAQALELSGNLNITDDAGTPATIAYIDETNKRFGVGTSTPGDALEVKSDESQIVLGSADYDIARLGYSGGVDTGYMGLLHNGTMNALISSNGDSYFNGGEVGIGTTSPGAGLEIQHDVSSSYGFIMENNHASGYGAKIIGGASAGGNSLEVENYVGTKLFEVAGNGNVWIVNDCSALTFTDRTPYPDSLQTAIDVVKSQERNPNATDKHDQLNHTKLHSFAKTMRQKKNSKGKARANKNGEPEMEEVGRDLSATVSCQNEVIKYLLDQVDELRAEINKLKGE